jgi:hypothetical protein
MTHPTSNDSPRQHVRFVCTGRGTHPAQHLRKIRLVRFADAPDDVHLQLGASVLRLRCPSCRTDRRLQYLPAMYETEPERLKQLATVLQGRPIAGDRAVLSPTGAERLARAAQDPHQTAVGRVLAALRHMRSQDPTARVYVIDASHRVYGW